AIALARQGADVAVAARGRSELEQVADEIRSVGRRSFVHALDLADTDAAMKMVDAAARELGSLDVLVNNAGGITDQPGSIGPLDDATLEAFDAMLRDQRAHATLRIGRRMPPYGQAGQGWRDSEHRLHRRCVPGADRRHIRLGEGGAGQPDEGPGLRGRQG